MSTPHPELEELAALAEAEPGPTELLAHVENCDQCSADVAALRGVRATLRALPPVSMPAEVATRLESALREARQAPAAAVSVLPAGRRQGRGARRGSFSGLPNFSAAAAVTVLLVAALGVGLALALGHGGDSKKGSTSAAGGGARAGAVITSSGTDYAQASIRHQVADLVLARVPDAHAQFKGLTPLADLATAPSAPPSAPPTAAPTASAAASAALKPEAAPSGNSPVFGADTPASTLPARTPFSGPLGTDAQLQACVQALLDQPATPVLVDYAYYDGKPATIIVLRDPTTPSVLDVYVEADTANCAKNGDVTFVAFLQNAS